MACSSPHEPRPGGHQPSRTWYCTARRPLQEVAIPCERREAEPLRKTDLLSDYVSGSRLALMCDQASIFGERKVSTR
jgi:hypothetical protein